MPLLLRLPLNLGQPFRTGTSSSILIQKIRLSTAPIVMAQEHKLKDLSSLDLKIGEKREVEVEGIENGKVLLAKVGSKIHALSANCTHYGAPLKNGVLTPDGRLTCPWHGGMNALIFFFSFYFFFFGGKDTAK